MIVPLMALALTACEQHEKGPTNPPTPKSSLVGLNDEASTDSIPDASKQINETNKINGELAKKIKDALQKDVTVVHQLRTIQIKADNSGVITLRGTVDTDRQKETIGRLVGNVVGVKQVDNQIQASAATLNRPAVNSSYNSNSSNNFNQNSNLNSTNSNFNSSVHH